MKRKRTGFRGLLGTAVAVLWLIAMPASARDERGGTPDGTAEWNAGLNAWQRHALDKARFHFERLAHTPRASNEMAAAGAYWTARAHLKTRHPGAVALWLHQAARHPDTFYGLLAHRALGREIHVDEETPPSENIGRLPEPYDATDSTNGEKERPPPDRKPDKRPAAAARYPVPMWRPDGGWRIDRALILAVARQESNFNPKARSPSGARGLMQLLPSTASFLSRSAGQTATPKASLYQPEINLMLGQRYLEHLLEDPDIKDNLLYMIAAYN
ncbi:MAG: soluble lytic murein transglycosylase and related regulatory protein [Rhodospirillaceae bacterium]|nr:MAG: soluble lytic murein transglycosylase and related regulatory protein [Rhodospirillaceae bacterium]